jgi:hypothetical protein
MRQCPGIDPNGGVSPGFGKIDAPTKKLGRRRMNEVKASAHSASLQKVVFWFSRKMMRKP